MADKHPEQSEQERLRQQEREHQQLEQEHQHSQPAPSPENTPTLDPRPTAEPIFTGSNDLAAELKRYPAAASPPEVLALRPRLYEDALSGPDEQISMIDYTVWQRPDGGSFLAPVANDQTYERKGYQRGENKRIPDLVAYLADLPKTDKQRERDKRIHDNVERHDRERRALHSDARLREHELAKEDKAREKQGQRAG